jgi:hypothetical protein
MSDRETTAATKLSQILKEAYECPPQTAIAEVWKKVLKFNPEGDRTIENKYLIMLSIFQYVKSDLSELSSTGINTEKYLSAIDQILTALFASPLQSQWAGSRTSIGVSNLHLLESFGEIIIARGKGLKDISQQETDELLSDIVSLISEIEMSEIDISIKNNLVEKLSKILKSLEDYEVFGAVVLQKVVKEALVETAIIYRTTDESKGDDNAIDKIEKTFNFLWKISTICATGEKIYPYLGALAEKIQHILPPGN